MLKKLFNKVGVVFRSLIVRYIALSRGSRISLSAKLQIHKGGALIVGRGVRVLHGSVLSVLPGAVLELKDGCILNHGVVVYCASRIEIGRESRIAHYCSVIDHDYDIRSSDSAFDVPKVSTPIIIGNNVWVGANTVILRGATIGKQCVIGAKSLVKKSVPDGMLAYCASNSQLMMKPLSKRDGFG